MTRFRARRTGVRAGADAGGSLTRTARNYPLRKLGAASLESDGRSGGDATPGAVRGSDKTRQINGRNALMLHI